MQVIAYKVSLTRLLPIRLTSTDRERGRQVGGAVGCEFGVAF
jgi:hypothetical protein